MPRGHTSLTDMSLDIAITIYWDASTVKAAVMLDYFVQSLLPRLVEPFRRLFFRRNELRFYYLYRYNKSSTGSI